MLIGYTKAVIATSIACMARFSFSSVENGVIISGEKLVGGLMNGIDLGGAGLLAYAIFLYSCITHEAVLF